MLVRLGNLLLYACALLAAAGIVYGLYVWSRPGEVTEVAQAEPKPEVPSEQPVKLAIQAQKNLGLISQSVQLTTFWRTIDVPAMITDRPGISDRGVVAPVSGIVTRIYHYPGDTVEPNAPLFDVRLVSESLHASQLELFKATREIEIAQQQLKRLSDIGQSGAIPQSRLIEIENQMRRLEVTVQAYRQDLQARGLPQERIDKAAAGQFVTDFVVKAPGSQALRVAEVALAAAEERDPNELPFAFELQKLNVALGQQVDAGQVLCGLADHRALLIEGRGFKDDMASIQEAARDAVVIDVEFESASDRNWQAFPKDLHIHHVANTIDQESRTFGFYLSLENQWQAYVHDGKERLLWRFRPGDRVRLHVPVEKMENVFVLPPEALVREGPNAFVFRQNGEFFNRRPVHVLYEDRLNVVIANDGSLRPGFFIAQNSAASINRVGKAQAASGEPVGLHVHPDGTVHAVH